jgi:hypothetical protein
MRILLIFILLTLLLAACRKKAAEIKCYECNMTYGSGISAGIQYPCTTNISQWQREQKDTNGDPLQSDCKEK